MDLFFFSSRRRHTRLQGDWSSDVCSSDLVQDVDPLAAQPLRHGRGVEAYLLGHGMERMSGQELDELLDRAIEGEIGRASCRERGESTGVVGSGEKKNDEGA